MHNGRLLVVQARNGKVSIPGGGSEKGESAACTAFRETWEETSLFVLPTKQAHQWPNGFIMFRCELQAAADDFSVRRPLEIRRVLWLEPEQFSDYKWRFPAQTSWLNDWLNKQKQTTKKAARQPQ